MERGGRIHRLKRFCNLKIFDSLAVQEWWQPRNIGLSITKEGEEEKYGTPRQSQIIFFLTQRANLSSRYPLLNALARGSSTMLSKTLFILGCGIVSASNSTIPCGWSDISTLASLAATGNISAFSSDDFNTACVNCLAASQSDCFESFDGSKPCNGLELADTITAEVGALSSFLLLSKLTKPPPKNAHLQDIENCQSLVTDMDQFVCSYNLISKLDDTECKLCLSVGGSSAFLNGTTEVDAQGVLG